MDTPSALIICEDGEDRKRIAGAAEKCWLKPVCSTSLDEARLLLSGNDFRVVLCSDNLSDGNIEAALKETRKASPTAPFIVLSRTADWGAYLHALGAGAFDYILCPPAPLEAERILWCALSDTTRPSTATRAAA